MKTIWRQTDFLSLSLSHETYETQGSKWPHEDSVRSSVLKIIVSLGWKKKVLDLEEWSLLGPCDPLIHLVPLGPSIKWIWANVRYRTQVSRFPRLTHLLEFCKRSGKAFANVQRMSLPLGHFGSAPASLIRQWCHFGMPADKSSENRPGGGGGGGAGGEGCVSCSVVSDSLRPCGLEPTRLLCPWNSPGENTGVGGQSRA